MTGEDFKKLRESLGLSQAALARHMGMSRQRIYALENETDGREPTKIHAAFLRYIAAHPPGVPDRE